MLLELEKELPIDIYWEVLGRGDTGVLKKVEINEETNEICFTINLPVKRMSEAIFKTDQKTIGFVESTNTIVASVWTIQLKRKVIIDDIQKS